MKAITKLAAIEFVLPSSVVGPSFRKRVATLAGGFTSWQGEGVWIDGEAVYNESVTVFRVALSLRDIASGKEEDLFSLVWEYAKEQGEKALYYGAPNRPAIYTTGN